MQVEAGGSAEVARLDSSQSGGWAPELLNYEVHTVPCFVLLDPEGELVVVGCVVLWMVRRLSSSWWTRRASPWLGEQFGSSHGQPRPLLLLAVGWQLPLVHSLFG